MFVFSIVGAFWVIARLPVDYLSRRSPTGSQPTHPLRRLTVGILRNIVGGLIALAFRLIGIVIAFAFMVAGILVSLTVIGAIVGVPLFIIGLIVLWKSVFG